MLPIEYLPQAAVIKASVATSTAIRANRNCMSFPFRDATTVWALLRCVLRRVSIMNRNNRRQAIAGTGSRHSGPVSGPTERFRYHEPTDGARHPDSALLRLDTGDP